MLFISVLVLFCLLFTVLLTNFSLWVSVVAVYLSGMLVVACVAFLGRRKAQLYENWEETPDVERVS